MPELWIPFGAVETLVTIQAENLGTVVDPEPEKGDFELERHAQQVKDSAAMFICDSAPATLEFLRELSPGLGAPQGLKIYSPYPKRVEGAAPELKGRISTLPPPIPGSDPDTAVYATELTEGGKKVFVGTAKPDPLFGIVDAVVQSLLNWVALSHSVSAGAREDMEPTPFTKSESYDEMEEMAKEVADGTFLTLVPRGGKLRSVMEDPPFDAVKNGFLEASVPQAKAMIVGSGGRGYDDTLSSAIRGVWGVLPAVRKAGSLLLVAECSEGLGSPALEMVATGRLNSEAGRRKEKYIEGLEEVSYLAKLKEEFDVLVLSGLPDVYAKSKLGLTTARGSGEAVGRLLNRIGRSGKVNIVPRSPECRLTST